MASNYSVRDAFDQLIIFGGSEVGGIQYPAHYAMQYGTHVWNVHPQISPDGTRCVVPFSRISTLGNNAAVVKSIPGQIATIVATNNHQTDQAYLKLYDKATLPVVGTDIPVAVFGLGAEGGGVSITFPTGLFFGFGIGMAITNNIANTNNSVAAEQVAVFIGFQ